MVAQHPPVTAVHKSSATTPSSDDDGEPAVARGNRNAVNCNGVQPCANGAAVSDEEAFSEEFVRKSKRCTCV